MPTVEEMFAQVAPIEASAPEPAVEAATLPEHLQPQALDNTYTEYGLRLSNGTVHWGVYLGNPLNTPQERSIMVLKLRKTAEEFGVNEAEFLAKFSWIGRGVIEKVLRHFTDAGIVPLESEAAAPALAGQNGQG